MVARLRRWKSVEAAGVKKRERERIEVRGVRRDVRLWCILMVGKELDCDALHRKSTRIKERRA